MNLIYLIHSYGISVSYSCDITKCILKIEAPTPSLLCLQTSKCPTLLKQLCNKPKKISKCTFFKPFSSLLTLAHSMFVLKAYLHVNPISHKACRFTTQTIHIFTLKWTNLLLNRTLALDV
jgi:hypothetical protein